MPETIPDRASNAGPEPEAPMDWRDCIDEARDEARSASRAMAVPSRPDLPGVCANQLRIAAIDRAIEALQSAKELLCR